MLLNKGLRTIVAKVCHATFYTKRSVFTYPVRMEFKTADRTNPLTHKTVVISYGTQVPSVQVVYLDHLTCRTTGKNNNISFTHYKQWASVFMACSRKSLTFKSDILTQRCACVVEEQE